MDLRGFWREETENAPKKKKMKKRRKKGRSLPSSCAILRANGVKPIGKPHPDYTDPKVFYASEAWKTLRYLALRNSSGRCQCCGASAKDGATLHVDHIVSRYKAPRLELELSNLQVLCLDCNTGKGAWDSTDWREHWKSI